MDLLDAIELQREDFVWRDGERLIAFGRAALASLPAFLRAAQIERYALVSTDRAVEQFGSIAIGGGETVDGAAEGLTVGPGGVAELAAELREQAAELPLIAVGGGRVIDVAKAIAATSGAKVVAIPTTLSGAPMSGVHRMPAGYAGSARAVRPAIVIADPQLMASQPDELRTGSAMNALSHAVESLFVEGGSAVPRLAAARAVRLIVRSLADRDLDETTRQVRLALGAVEAGYAMGSTGYALHHVLCQTVVRVGELPHAPVYGIVLPYTLELYKLRDDLTWNLVAEAAGSDEPSRRIAEICAAAGLPTSLSGLGLAPERVDSIVAAAAGRRELVLTPGGATPADVSALVNAAL